MTHTPMDQVTDLELRHTGRAFHETKDATHWRITWYAEKANFPMLDVARVKGILA